MHNIIRQFILLCIVLILTGCATCTTDQKITPIDENWLCRLNHDPADWLQCADNWFINGHLNPAYRVNSNSLMKVRVPNFDRIVANGKFTVQIVGGQRKNSIAILGPYPAARQALVDVRNGTLYISQPKDMDLSKVIVRVGMRGPLHGLSNYGCGSIYGRKISSNGLCIYSYNSGNIMLVGNMNLQQVNHFGCGTITVFGANTPALAIKVIGNGSLNLCGQVGAQSIIHRGNGKIDIIGLNSPWLTIDASGRGITQAVGVANLKKVTAGDQSQVYLYWINSDGTTVIERDRARVGLAGTTSNLTVDTKNFSQFEGQNFFARRAFVTTEHFSHANVNATQQMFLKAQDHSSIYYFTSVKELATLTYGEGIIIRTHSNPCACRVAPPVFVKSVYKGS